MLKAVVNNAKSGCTGVSWTRDSNKRREDICSKQLHPVPDGPVSPTAIDSPRKTPMSTLRGWREEGLFSWPMWCSCICQLGGEGVE